MTALGFRDSANAVRDGRFVVESATALPVTIMPAYAGSRRLVLGLDASGLQGLGHGAQRAFGGEVGTSGDLYIVRPGWVSDVISPRNVHPMGRLSWSMQIGGRTIGPDELPTAAGNWTRHIDLVRGSVRTRMLVAELVWVQIDVTVPWGRAAIVCDVRFDTHALPNPGPWLRRDLPTDIEFRIRLDTTTWDGRALFRPVAATAEQRLRLIPAADALAGSDLGWTAEPAPYVRSDPEGLDLSWVLPLSGGPAEVQLGLGWDDTEVVVQDLRDQVRASDADWERQQVDVANIVGLSAVEDTLFAVSNVLLRSGFEPAHGLPIGSPFTHPPAWKCSTFWDSHFVVDALLVSGRHRAAIDFVHMLRRVMAPEGRPFPWMFDAAGQATVESSRDLAPLVVAAHAMSAVKTYMYTLDEDLYRDAVSPICRRVCEWAVRELFVRDPAGYRIIAVAHDVADAPAAEHNQTFTGVWFRSVFTATVALARQHGDNAPFLDELEEICANQVIEHTADEYLHAQGMTAEQNPMASFVPFLLYPTEARPFVDAALFDRTRDRYDFLELYARKQGDFQPWPAFMQAHNDIRRGAVEAARWSVQRGLTGVHGPGYFSEIAPMQETVALPPYITAHSAFVSLALFRLVAYSIWERWIGLFGGLTDDEVMTAQIAAERVNVPGRLRVDAAVSGGQVRARLHGASAGLTVTLPTPADGVVVVGGIAVRSVPGAHSRALVVIPDGLGNCVDLSYRAAVG